MQKVVVTGGSGFIGTNLIDRLIADGFAVINIDRSKPLKDEHAKYWKQIDILDLKNLKECITSFGPDILIHLAAVTDLDGKDLAYYSANIEGTANIIEIASAIPTLQRVIYTSSMYVCRPGFIPSDYNTYTPHTVYGESKVQMEHLVRKIKDVSYKWCIIRPTSIWGPWFNVPYIDFFKTVYKKRFFSFSKACTKTYGYIDNTVFQIMGLLKAEESLMHQQAFYLGDMPAIQIAEWGNEISVEMKLGKIMNLPFFALKSAAFLGDALGLLGIRFPLTSFRLSNMTTNNVLPLEDIYNVTGKPPISRIDGVRKTLQWLSQYKGYKF